jgi:hypothetical protein
LKAKAGRKGGEYMRSGLKKRLMSFLRTVYDGKSDIFLSQRTGRGSWIVLVGPVKYDKKRRRDRKRERKKITQMMILVEHRSLVLLNIVLEKKDVLSACIIVLEQVLVSSASASLIPVRLRTLIQALVQEIGENC